MRICYTCFTSGALWISIDVVKCSIPKMIACICDDNAIM